MACDIKCVIQVLVMLTIDKTSSQNNPFKSVPVTVKTYENETVLLPCYVDNTGMREQDIENLLANSDLEDFLPSDEDLDDPPYVAPQERTSSSSSEENSEDHVMTDMEVGATGEFGVMEVIVS
ncbi:unnamed protein product [Diatraea saccharalis]|uniref:Uncharacterized protein n=1 Tax=Diatraea saccharalis TaxID=40085 RepID=A0A9N9R5U7_9NEOP|nr:unnamed protein product [Diatraea saccharalis]